MGPPFIQVSIGRIGALSPTSNACGGDAPWILLSLFAIDWVSGFFSACTLLDDVSVDFTTQGESLIGTRSLSPACRIAFCLLPLTSTIPVLTDISVGTAF